MFTIAKVLLIIAVATCVFHPIYALKEERQQVLSREDIAANDSSSSSWLPLSTNQTSFEDFLQTDEMVGFGRSGDLRRNPRKMLKILRILQCGFVYRTDGEGSITATFLGAGDKVKELVGGNGWDATTEYLSSPNWSAIEFDVSANVCIKELYIACKENAHKSGSERFQIWNAKKIDREGREKAGKSWWRGDDCYHIGWFQVREDFMDWA